MKVRIISAVVGIVILVGIVVASLMLEESILCFALAAIALLAVYEGLNAVGTLKNPTISIPCFIYTVFVELTFLMSGRLSAIILATLIYVMIMFICALGKYEKIPVSQIAMSLMMTMVITFAVYSAIYMYYLHNPGEAASYGISMLVFCLLCSWLTDTGAYFAGTLFGKHKLSPKISPKKTIEGAIGGVIVCVGLTWAIAYLCTSVCGIIDGYTVNPANLIILTAVCSIISMIGDLSFSVVKRTYGVKDYGNIMPGHGGVLDRFDSFMFVAPFVCVLTKYLPVLVAA